MQCNFTSCRKTGKIDPDALSPSEIMLARHIKTENYQAVKNSPNADENNISINWF